MDDKQTSGSNTPTPGTGAQPLVDDKRTPGNQNRVLTPDEDLDHAVEETFPASDPISPSRIDTPST